MTRLATAATRWIVVAALAATFAMWLAAASAFTVGIQRARHATLDAASVAVRDAVGNAGAPATATWLASMKETFAMWNVNVAAFDRSGTFVAGDDRLRGDGLPVGRQPAPPVAQQVALVTTRDGYVLLVPNAGSVGRLRIFLALVLGVMLLLSGGVSYGLAQVWTRERTRGFTRLRDGLAAIAAGAGPAALPPDGDALSEEITRPARDAVERLACELDSRATGEERLRAFLAEAGHELRTPLAIAIGYTGILKRGAIADAALAERIVGDISAEHERLQRLVERMLQLARLDAVPGDEGASADAVAVAREAIALVRPLDPERPIEFDAPASAHAAIAADDLRDAVRNLLENALRYAPAASIAVRVATGSDVSIRVEDSGPGMDAFTAEHAFDRFFRGSDRGDVPGTGLGLAIVRRILERARGSVTLDSAPGRGTVIELRIPRAG